MGKKMDMGMKDMPKITALQIPKILKRMFETKQLCFFMGKPGTGKTAGTYYAAEILAKERGRNFIGNPSLEDWKEGNFCLGVINAAHLDETDPKGIPKHIETEEGLITKFIRTELFPMNKKAEGIIFFDEFPNARTAVQDAFQTILLNRRVGDMKLPDGVLFILAGNRPQDGVMNNISPAMRNRFSWFEVEVPEMKDWIKLMRTINKPINTQVEGFLLSVGQKYWDNYEPNDDQYAYCTPRSMDLASQDINGMTDIEDMSLLIGGRLGESFALDFKAFIKLTEKIDVDKIMKNPKMINEYEKDISSLYAICCCLVDKAKDAKTHEPIMKVIGQLDKKEFGMFVLANVKDRYGNELFKDMLKSDIAICKKYVEVLGGVI